MIQTNLSRFDKKVIFMHIFVQITFQTSKRNTGFYVLRQGVPDGHSSEDMLVLNKSSLGTGT